jgi:hypothetical protein
VHKSSTPQRAAWSAGRLKECGHPLARDGWLEDTNPWVCPGRQDTQLRLQSSASLYVSHALLASTAGEEGPWSGKLLTSLCRPMIQA